MNAWKKLGHHKLVLEIAASEVDFASPGLTIETTLRALHALQLQLLHWSSKGVSSLNLAVIQLESFKMLARTLVQIESCRSVECRHLA